MNSLPVWHSAGVKFLLPLFDATALDLLEITASEAGPERKTRIREVLHADPWLGLWVSLRFPTKPDDVDVLSDWLESRLLDALTWGTEPCGAEDVVADREDLVNWGCSVVARTLDGAMDLVDALVVVGQEGFDCLFKRTQMVHQDDVLRALPAWLTDAASVKVSSRELADEQRISAARQRYATHRVTAVAALRSAVKQACRLVTLESRFAEALEQEKLDAMKELAYGASHEINNPLANISTRAQTLLRDETDPSRQRQLATINRQAFRAHEMITDLMLFARPPSLHKQCVDVSSWIGTVVTESADEAARQQTDLAVRLPEEPLQMDADPTQLAVVLKALIRNSLEALGQGGEISVDVVPLPAGMDGRAGVQIRVADTGPGLSPEVRRHAFDPFYSGREAGRGLGFGLSKCWRIVELHGGSIVVESDNDKGAAVTVTLPDDDNSDLSAKHVEQESHG